MLLCGLLHCELLLRGGRRMRRKGLLSWASFVLQRACAWVAIRVVAVGIPFRVASPSAVCRGVAMHAAALAKETGAARSVFAAEMGAVNMPVWAPAVKSRVWRRNDWGCWGRRLNVVQLRKRRRGRGMMNVPLRLRLDLAEALHC